MSRTEGLNLILGITPGANWHVVKLFFEHTGWDISIKNSETCNENAEGYIREDSRFLLLHSHPEEAIAHSIASGVPPEQATAAWLIGAKAMVDFYRQHRKQAVVVYLPNLLANPKAQLSTIADQLGLSDHSLPTTVPQVEQAPLLERLMAVQLLHQTSCITDLLAQIEACTLPLQGYSYEAPSLDTGEANRQLVALRASLAEHEKQAIRLKQEILQHVATKQRSEATYKAELDEAYTKLHRAGATNKKLDDELTGLHKHVADLALQKEQQAALRSQLADVMLKSQQEKDECNLLMDQLHLVQEELEKKYVSHDRVREQLIQLEAEQQRNLQEKQEAENAKLLLQKQLIEIDAEHKEELNQAHVKLRCAVDAKSKQEKELEAKLISHSQLKEQLVHIEKSWKNDQQLIKKSEKNLQRSEQIRSALEAKYKEKFSQTISTLRSVEKANSKLKCQLIEQQKLASEFAEHRNQQDAVLDAANHEVQRLQKELSNVKSSIAYKTTAPIRVLRAKLRSIPVKRALNKQAREVRKSGLFDVGWYLKTYPDVAENGIDPILHYLKFGAEERRNPSPDFDTDLYLTSHPEVVDRGINPLLHYYTLGQQERRLRSHQDIPLFPTPGTV